MISSLYYYSLIEQIFARLPDGVKWRFDENLRVVAECGADYPNLFFMFEQMWLEVQAKDYVVREQDDDWCYFLILPTDLPFNMLGVPIFNDYYSVFQQVHGKISFGPLQDSTKRRVKEGVLFPQP